MSGETTLREMAEADAPVIAAAFAAQGWQKPIAQYLHYWQEHLAGQRAVLLAEYGVLGEYAGEFAGYVTIVWESEYPPFRQAGIPEIVDFNVLLKYRRRGIGAALMDAAEARIAAAARAAARAPVAGLGVCLHSDYGAAQALYIRRGYVPDGRGVFYQGRYPQYGEQVEIGDDLTLYLTKRLTPAPS